MKTKPVTTDSGELTPKKMLEYLVLDAKDQGEMFGHIGVESIEKARQKALDAIAYYKEIKNDSIRRSKRIALYNQCLELIEKI